jgi:starch synthase (maltosyl-transferring)
VTHLPATPPTGSPLSRVVINGLRPTTPDGVSDAKAVLDRPLLCSANIFADGHDELSARLWWRAVPGRWSSVALEPLGNDRWQATVTPRQIGRHELVIEGWVDEHATWRKRVTAKLAAGQDSEPELEAEARLIASRLDDLERIDPALGTAAELAVRALRDTSLDPSERVARACAPVLATALSALPDAHTTVSRPQLVWADRERAAVGAWYELFPRSYGGFRGAITRLAAAAEMGFDVVYLPPIHPIGVTARKGPDNTLDAAPGDPGSPWAIGSLDGGHTAIDPALGTVEDFDAFVAEAHRRGLEVALDFALQCSPDHPWVSEHPEWFHHRPDGSIRFAENPPKQYQDIFPIDFLPANDAHRQALWSATRDALEYWIDHDVHIFRVDNPHTKPFAYWQWLIADVRTRHPEVVLLAEAFTRPRIMERLAEIGFSQGYTYFTWRTSRSELASYAEELAHGPASDYFRPNLWPNTPDILAGPLRHGGLGVFKMRAALAATIGPSWGVYSGYELGENQPASDTNEEYAHSEKYQLVRRDFDTWWSLAPYLGLLNRTRRRHPALSDLASLRVHWASDDQLLVFSKQFPGPTGVVDTVLVVINVDPLATHDGRLWIDLGALGLPWDEALDAYDEISGQMFNWFGPEPYVRLDPGEPAHVIDLRPARARPA